MNDEDIKTVVRLLKKGMSPTKICDNTPFPYEVVKDEYEKMKTLEDEE